MIATVTIRIPEPTRWLVRKSTIGVSWNVASVEGEPFAVTTEDGKTMIWTKEAVQSPPAPPGIS